MKITSQVFMGDGDRSLSEVGHCFLLLTEAFNLLNAIQQPVNPCDPDVDYAAYEDEVFSSKKRLEEIAKEINTALLGRKRRA